MQTIYSTPKETFAGIWGMSKVEKLASALVLTLLGSAILPAALHYAGIRATGAGGGLMPLLAIAAAIYFVGGSLTTLIVERHNRPLQIHIDAVDEAIATRAGRSFDRDATPVLIGMAVAGGRTVANIRKNDISYDFVFSGAGPDMTVSTTGTVKRSPVKAFLMNIAAVTRHA